MKNKKAQTGADHSSLKYQRWPPCKQDNVPWRKAEVGGEKQSISQCVGCSNTHLCFRRQANQGARMM